MAFRAKVRQIEAEVTQVLNLARFQVLRSARREAGSCRHRQRLVPIPAEAELDEVNFWQRGGNREFQALQPGEPFLFKPHSPEKFGAVLVPGRCFILMTWVGH